MSISIAYLFSQVELAQNNAIYCGMCKLHAVDSELARSAVDRHEMRRSDFRTFYQAVFGKKQKPDTAALIKTAEATRDRIVHGKKVTDADLRQAISAIISYAVAFNNDVSAIAGFKPFGSLQGFKGAGKPLDKSTSRWVIKGMGLVV